MKTKSLQDYNKEIFLDILKIKKSGKVLDFGCGEGKISLLLAEKGFQVSCIDISKTAIQSIKEASKKRKLKVKIIIADLGDYNLKENYDLIIALGIFHFFPRKKALELINKIKMHTKKDGINIVDAFVGKKYFKSKELKKMYKNWNIIDFEEYKFKKDKMNYILAVK